MKINKKGGKSFYEFQKRKTDKKSDINTLQYDKKSLEIPLKMGTFFGDLQVMWLKEIWRGWVALLASF